MTPPGRRGTLAAGLAMGAVAILALAGCQTDSPVEAGTTPAESTTVSSTPAPAAPSTASSAGTTTIEAPASGSTVAGPTVTVSGTGTAFEGTLLYLVLDAEGTTVAEGYTTAGANGEIGPFSVDVTLDPGLYTVQVWEPGMGEGDASAPPENLAEVTFTVS